MAGEPAASSTSPVWPAVAAARDVEVGEGGGGGEGEGAGGERVNGSWRTYSLVYLSSEGRGGLDSASATLFASPATCLMSVVN